MSLHRELIQSRESLWQPHDGMLDANFSHALGSEKIAVHWFKLPPSQRSSYPHAESLEEEFIYVVRGRPHVWVNGFIYSLEPEMIVGFPPGTGIAHSFINNTQEDVELIVLGERFKKENKYIYPVHPELFEEHKDNWWAECPTQEMGPHKGEIGDLNHQRDWRELPFIKNLSELKRGASFSYPGDSETFSEGVRLSEHVGLKTVGVWHEVMKPGKRSSWPHAHKFEEEFAVLLKGQARVWLNGHVHELEPGDCVFFKPGTNIAHTLLNESDGEIEYLGIGQSDAAGSDERIFYPLHATRNENCEEEGCLWKEAPRTLQLGDHLGLPQVRDAQIVKQESAHAFLDLMSPLLSEREAEYSLLLGITALRTKLDAKIDEYGYFAVYQNRTLVGGCLTGPKNLVISLIPAPLLLPLAQTLLDTGVEFPGVVGPSVTSEAFAQVWSHISGRKFKLGMSQKIYQLNEVVMPNERDGELLVANSSHEDQVAQWVLEFSQESLPHESTTLDQAREVAKKKIANGEVYLWQNKEGHLVSMNYVGCPTNNGMSVSAVYTPKNQRRRGYASQLVASTSQRCLDQGKTFCVLYTDLSNPTSNGIYQKIGYKEVATSKHFVFGPISDE